MLVLPAVRPCAGRRIRINLYGAMTIDVLIFGYTHGLYTHTYYLRNVVCLSASYTDTRHSDV